MTISKKTSAAPFPGNVAQNPKSRPIGQKTKKAGA